MTVVLQLTNGRTKEYSTTQYWPPPPYIQNMHTVCGLDEIDPGCEHLRCAKASLSWRIGALSLYSIITFLIFGLISIFSIGQLAVGIFFILFCIFICWSRLNALTAYHELEEFETRGTIDNIRAIQILHHDASKSHFGFINQEQIDRIIQYGKGGY